MVANSERLPSDRPVRLALIGLGGAAQLIHLPILEQMGSIDLVGLADEDRYKLSRVTEKYGVPGHVDIENLIRKTNPDVVMICTPTITHLPLALSALEGGAHVIVEKPVTRNLSETKRLQEAARDRSRSVFVAMNQRFRQDVSVLRNFVTADELGKIWRIRSGWLKRFGGWDRSPWLDKKTISGGGVLMDLGIQLLDVILWALDYPDIRRVSAWSHHENLNREVEDTFSSAVELGNGTLVHLDCSWGLLAEHNVAYTHVEGTKATASLNPLVLHKTVQDELVTVTPVKSAAPRDLYNASFEAQMHHFVASLRGEKKDISTIDEAVRVMELIDLMYQSANSGREIVLDH
ncbi:Gfo/Idh/MocA family oxidoreductase [bacterium]|nr:Gfo/Idh/MocA family oxidoreductase [bacterium]